MKFHSVTIKNFKGIEDITLKLNPGVNCLLGENGAGKTSVLEAMTIALSDYFNGLTGVSKKGIHVDDIRFNTKISGDASSNIEYFRPTTIKSEFYLDNETVSGEVSRRDETNLSRTKFLGKKISHYAKDLCNDKQAILPLICYFSTQRMSHPKREDFGTTSKNKLNDRRCGYIGCIDNNLDQKALEAWCLKMEQIEFKEKKTIHEYQVFKEIVSNFMQNMNELDSSPEIYYSRVFDDLVYVEEGEATPIHYLSAGYQSLLWIIMTIAFRLCQLNPSITNYREAPGIILIDEIDMHLHPRWQWKIIDSLYDTFPNIQFVLATHAPIIISSSKKSHLILIENTKGKHSVHYPPSAYAVAIDDIVELTQGSVGVPKLLREYTRQFEQAFYNNDKASATEIYQKMREEFGDNNSAVDLANRRLSIL